MEARAATGDGAAHLAIDVYLHRLSAGIAAMAAAAGGLDVLVFTGGAGEHSPLVRRRTAEQLAGPGVAIDANANEADRDDTDITGSDSPIQCVVVAAREDLQIAREARPVVTA